MLRPMAIALFIRRSYVFRGYRRLAAAHSAKTSLGISSLRTLIIIGLGRLVIADDFCDLYVTIPKTLVLI